MYGFAKFYYVLKSVPWRGGKPCELLSCEVRGYLFIISDGLVSVTYCYEF